MNKRERFKKALQQPWAAMTFAACSAVVLFLLLSNLRVIGRGIGGLIGFVKPVLIGLIIAYVTDPWLSFLNRRYSEGSGRILSGEDWVSCLHFSASSCLSF